MLLLLLLSPSRCCAHRLPVAAPPVEQQQLHTRLHCGLQAAPGAAGETGLGQRAHTPALQGRVALRLDTNRHLHRLALLTATQPQHAREADVVLGLLGSRRLMCCCSSSCLGVPYTGRSDGTAPRCDGMHASTSMCSAAGDCMVCLSTVEHQQPPQQPQQLVSESERFMATLFHWWLFAGCLLSRAVVLGTRPAPICS